MARERAKGPWKSVLAAVLVVAASLNMAGTPAQAAGSHAVVVGSDPADGAVVEHAPDRVTLFLDSKAGTVEGDPLQVYGPSGQRVDDGTAVASDDGSELSVGLAPGTSRGAGDYHVVFRVVSVDTHLVTGRIQFRAREGAAAEAGPPGSEHSHLVHGWAGDIRPRLLLVAVGFCIVGVLVRQRMRQRRTEPPVVARGRAA